MTEQKPELLKALEVELIDNIDYNSLEPGDEKLSQKIFHMLKEHNIDFKCWRKIA